MLRLVPGEVVVVECLSVLSISDCSNPYNSQALSTRPTNHDCDRNTESALITAGKITIVDRRVTLAPSLRAMPSLSFDTGSVGMSDCFGPGPQTSDTLF